MTVQTLDTGPWYREPWPWILIAIPASSVVFGFLMLSLALGTNNSLVVDDYYREGKAINQRIERDRRAAELGVVARVETGGEELALVIGGRDGEAASAPMLPPQILLRWAHVTQDTRDGQAILRPVGAGRYASPGGPDDPSPGFPDDGRYRIHIEPFGGDWRLVSPVLVLSDTGTFTIEARAPRPAPEPSS